MRIQLDEEKGGHYAPVGSQAAALPGGEFVFQVHVDCHEVGFKEAKGAINGTLRMAGLGEKIPVEGTIEVSPHWYRHIIYAFRFEAGGKAYQFQGAKQVSFLRLAKTMTTLPGELIDIETGDKVADVLTTFNMGRDLWSFMKSYRFSLGAESAKRPVSTVS